MQRNNSIIAFQFLFSLLRITTVSAVSRCFINEGKREANEFPVKIRVRITPASLGELRRVGPDGLSRKLIGHRGGIRICVNSAWEGARPTRSAHLGSSNSTKAKGGPRRFFRSTKVTLPNL